MFKYTSDELSIDLNCSAEVEFHLLIGSNDHVIGLTMNGLKVDYCIEMVEKSRYINFLASIEHRADIRITFKG